MNDRRGRRTEEQLRDALREYADPIEPAPGSWSRIEDRLTEPAPRRVARHRALVFATALLAVALIVGTVIVVRGDGSSDSSRRVTAAGTPVPDYAVAVTAAHDLVVIDARTGEAIRTLAHDVQVDGGVPALAPTPDGRSVYFTTRVAEGPAGCGPQGVVLVVPVDGGEPKLRGTGEDVALSPDGTRIATAPLDADPGCAANAPVIEIRPVGSGGSAQTVPVPSGVTDLSLSRSSLAYTVPVDGLPRETWVADLDGGTAMRMRDWSDAQGPYTFRGATGELVGAHTNRITRADPELRRFLPDVAHSPAPVAGAVHSDSTGDHLLWTGADGVLYQWNAVDHQVRRVRTDVVTAAWLPATVTSPAPAETRGLVMARVDGRIVADERLLTEADGVDAVSTASSGNEVLFTTRQGRECSVRDGSTQPEIDRLPLEPGAERVRVVGGARAPVVTPNGVWVVYGYQCDGVGLGVTNLMTGENYRTDFLPAAMRGSPVARVEVLGASPNSRRLVYRVTFAGDVDPRYYASCLWPLVEHRDTSIVELPYGSAITAAAFVDDDAVALAETTSSGDTEIRRWSLRQDDGRKEPSPVIFTVPDRVTSLVADSRGSDFLALTDDHVLYRFRGDQGLVQVAKDVRAVAWSGAAGS